MMMVLLLFSTLWGSGQGCTPRAASLERGDNSELMINNGHVRKHYSNLVPSTVPHKLFWVRYFFKVHLIDQQEVKRQALRRRAEEAKVESDSEINWDEDE